MKISILQLTKDCNQECPYCTRDRSIHEDSFESLKLKIDSLSYDVDTLIITGGEPTLKNDLVELVFYASKKIKNIHLQSNGINLEDFEYCKKLVRAGISSCLIALPSHIKKTCEDMAGISDVFEKKIQGLRNMSRFADVETGVVFVVTKKNFMDFPEYVDFVSRISRDIYIQITYMIRFTNISTKLKPLMAKYSEFKPYLDNGLKLCKDKNMNFRIDGFPLCFVKNHIDYVSDLLDRKYDFVQDFIGSKRIEYDSNNYIGKEHIKIEACKFCKLNSKCKGIYTHYADIFWTSEISPHG